LIFPFLWFTDLLALEVFYVRQAQIAGEASLKGYYMSSALFVLGFGQVVMISLGWALIRRLRGEVWESPGGS
jgi:hypothetical protein